jgi:dTDP-4-amino-4,6-dideoxygalactose transaminase
MYYVLLNSKADRQRVIKEFKKNNIGVVFHYVPLHSSPGGLRYGRAHGELNITLQQSERLIRLPMWIGLSFEQQCRVIEILSGLAV